MAHKVALVGAMGVKALCGRMAHTVLPMAVPYTLPIPALAALLVQVQMAGVGAETQGVLVWRVVWVGGVLVVRHPTPMILP